MRFALKRSLAVGFVVFLVMSLLEQSASFMSAPTNNRRIHSHDPASFLVPSQVKVATTTTRAAASEPASSSDELLPPLQLIPSQIKLTSTSQTKRRQHQTRQKMTNNSNTTFVSSFTKLEETASDGSSSAKQKRKRGRRRQRRKHMMKKDEPNNNNENTRRQRRILMGNLPDIHWRAVPMDHLRLHPLFQELPPPESIISLESLEDVRMFSQESWQWDALHNGRCTTSKAASALGLLDPKAGHVLNIPASWRKGGKSAYYRLSEKPLCTLEEMNDVLCNGDVIDMIRHPLHHHSHENEGPVWVMPRPRNDGTTFPFAAKYLIKITPEERSRRKKVAKQYEAENGLFLSVRMSWGTAQEATSLLTALNYFWKKDPGIRLEEVGMCGAGLSSNQTGSVLVGASPDAILHHSNGTKEVLEVKNHCPFVPASYVDEDEESSPNYAVRQIPFRNPTVPPLYVPQLMMEMLCVGPECRSAIMVRQTATNGAVVMRMYRDDEWIYEMMYWLNRFQQDYVEKAVVPPKDFFWDDNDESGRYQRFVNWTKELTTSNVEVLDIVKHHEIQRVVATSRNITSLFLD